MECLEREKYCNDIMNWGKGIFFFSNKPVPEYWSWSSHKSRAVETSLARLRIGHIGLNSHLFKIGKESTDECICGSVETVDHFLLHCPQYGAERKILSDHLQSIEVPLTRTNLLGGGNFNESKQFMIQSHLADFLVSSGKMGQF